MTVSYAEPTCYSQALRRGLLPDPDQTVDQWADQNMILPIGLSAEPGPWRTSRTPYMREIMVELSPSSRTEEVVLMKASQIAGTAAGVNWMGFIINRAPGPMLIVEPTVDVAKKLSKLRLKPMLELVPCLQGRVREARSRDSGNTTLLKEFDGGVLALVGANSGVGLRFLSARYLMLDEVDGYPQDVDQEGHPADLAKNRTTTFANRKIFIPSTPAEQHTSYIEPAYESGSRAHYHVPCPICLFEQALRWANIKFAYEMSGKAVKVTQVNYECDHCHKLIPESQKTWMLDSGRWVHEDPENPVKSYHLNALYAPYGWTAVSWPSLVKEWVLASHKAERGDTRALKKFITTKLAETWKQKGEQIEKDTLKARREVYEADCPEGVLLLTAAVDVQHDRLEAECVGWGKGEESWSIDYQRFLGDPTQREVWDRLDTWLQQNYAHASGVGMKAQIAFVDTGYLAKEACQFVSTRQGRRIFASKGSNQPGARIVTMGSVDKLTKVQLFLIGTDTAKDTLFTRLVLKEAGPGYLHFPSEVKDGTRTIVKDQYDEEYFAQLTAEEKRQKFKKGVLLGTEYHKIRNRNEALDLKVMNQAALAALNPDLDKLAEQWPAKVERMKAQQANPEQEKPKQQPRVKRSSWIDRG